MDIIKVMKGIVFKSTGKSSAVKAKLRKTDLGILKVALMVAALDGKVLESEYEAFRLLAQKGMGYSDAATEEALREAMRSAGYMLLVASSGISQDDLVAEFMKEAEAALPTGFAYLSVEDVRRAIVLWIAMGLSDGDFSVREKACIEAIRKHFAELKIERADEEFERGMALSPAFRMAYGPGSVRLAETLIPKSFAERVQDLVARYGDSADAAKELKNLINA